jgi:hypothetical protein
MRRLISDDEFYGWVADMTGEMASLSGPRSAELAAALEGATIVAKRLGRIANDAAPADRLKFSALAQK